MRPISQQSRDRVLGALAMGYSYDRAAKFAGIGRRTVFELKKTDLDFAAACETAYEAGTDKLEDEARRRAFEGVDRPIFQGGKLVGHERQFSDRLLEIALKARRPEKYRERVTTEVAPMSVTHKHDHVHRVADADLGALSAGQLADLYRETVAEAPGGPAKPGRTAH